jgi:hypothetical protein
MTNTLAYYNGRITYVSEQFYDVDPGENLTVKTISISLQNFHKIPYKI